MRLCECLSLDELEAFPSPRKCRKCKKLLKRVAELMPVAPSILNWRLKSLVKYVMMLVKKYHEHAPHNSKPSDLLATIFLEVGGRPVAK